MLVGLPRSARYAIKRLAWRGARFVCPVCGSAVRTFHPLAHRFRVTLDIAGERRSFRDFETINADYYSCPVCGATDRERLMAMWLRREPSLVAPAADGAAATDRGAPRRVLHLAPEPALLALLRGLPGLQVVTADRDRRDVDVRADITTLAAFADDSCEGLLCAHILEHVPADRQALGALLRVLGPGGWALLMVPILRGLQQDYEDPSVHDDDGRLRHFGQADHVRVYSHAGWTDKIRQAGFELEELGLPHFGAASYARHGLDPGALLYVARKPRRPGGTDAG